jgi:cell division protein FtsQ
VRGALGGEVASVARVVGNRRRVDVRPGERRRRLARAAMLAFPTVASLTVLSAASWLGWRYAAAGDLLRVRAVRFEGASRARPEELAELCPVKPGDHLLLVDGDLVVRALLRHPWVAGVEVERVLPPAVVVRIAERRAVALAELGGLYLVDERGVVFKRAATGDGLDLPVVTGITRQDFLENEAEVAPRLVAALALLRRWSDLRLDRRQAISQIHLDPDYGTTVWAGDDGVEIRLGHGDLEEKLARLERVLAAVQSEGRRPRVLHLDNRRRPDWVAVRFDDSRGGPESARP